MTGGGSRYLPLLLLAALLSASLPAQRPAFAVRKYTFHLFLPDTGKSFAAIAVIRLARVGTGDDTVRFDLVGLTVDSVWAMDPSVAADSGGRDDSAAVVPAQSPSYSYDGRRLRIAVRHGSTASDGDMLLAVAYHGTPTDGLIIGANSRGQPTVFADNWPERARYWLPTMDRPSGKAAVSFLVFAPRLFRVIAVGQRDSGMGVADWTEAKPIPPYTMVIGAAVFTVSHHRDTRSGVPIEVWAYPEDSTFADSVPFRRATEIVETMERLVGPFPYEKLAHVESSTRYGGMENSSAIFYPEMPYVERRMGEGVVRHETSHQWFGDAITEREWAHLWLSEGFASYFDLVIGAALDGDSVLAVGMARNARMYFASQVVNRPLVDTAEHDPNKLLNENSYQKGAWVLHMLRGVMGDSAFFRGIREYYRVYRDSTALSADLQRVMERTGGRQLDWFFRQWLRQPGYPRLAVRWRYAAADHRVRLDITEDQPGAWGVFRLPGVVIEAVTATGGATRRVYTIDGRTSVAYLQLDSPPTAIRVDPEGRLLLQSSVTP